MSGQQWVWVSRPEHYRDAHGGEHPHLDPAVAWVPEPWCCSPRTRAGDLGVVYRSRECRDISHLVAARSDAERSEDPATGPAARWACRVQVLARFERPLGLAEMRADPVLREWPALRASFVQRCFPVPDDVWERLLELLDVGPDELRA